MLPFPSDRNGSWKGQRTGRAASPEVPTLSPASGGAHPQEQTMPARYPVALPLTRLDPRRAPSGKSCDGQLARLCRSPLGSRQAQRTATAPSGIEQCDVRRMLREGVISILVEGNSGRFHRISCSRSLLSRRRCSSSVLPGAPPDVLPLAALLQLLQYAFSRARMSAFDVHPSPVAGLPSSPRTARQVPFFVQLHESAAENSDRTPQAGALHQAHSGSSTKSLCASARRRRRPGWAEDQLRFTAEAMSLT